MPEDRSSKQPPAGDDRNLVVVDEDFVNADAEDRLWLFWERNQGVIVKATVAVVVGILGYLAIFFWNEAQREALGEEFTACQDEAARRAFAFLAHLAGRSRAITAACAWHHPVVLSLLWQARFRVGLSGFWTMWTTRKIITYIMGVVGIALIVRGLIGGFWPLSVQLIAGVLLLTLAVLRWRYIT